MDLSPLTFKSLFSEKTLKPESWIRDTLLTFIFHVSTGSLGFPGGSVVNNPPANAGDAGSIPGSENPLEEEMTTCSSVLAWRDHMDRETWQDVVHGVTKELDMTEQPSAGMHGIIR